MDFLWILIAAVGAFYAGYQRGRVVEVIKDYNARKALVVIVEILGNEQLSTLGTEVKKIALNGLK